MRGDLLWTNSLKQGLHVVEVREDKRVLIAVVGMHVTLPHVLQVLLVVALSVLSLVHWFLLLLWLTLCALLLLFVSLFKLRFDVKSHGEVSCLGDGSSDHSVQVTQILGKDVW